MSSLAFPLDPLNNTRCIICDNYLSVAPIITSHNGRAYKCGRCEKIQTKNLNIRLFYLEDIAKHFTFPCMYAQCNQILPFNDVANHEKVCNKRTIPCPIESCTYFVMVSNVKTHFEENHRANIFHEDFTSNQLRIPNTYGFLLIKNDAPFFIYLSLGQEISCFAVFSLDQPFYPNLKFSTKIMNSRGNVVYTGEDKVISFNEQEHCFKCITKKCWLRYHKYSRLNPQNIRLCNTVSQHSSTFIRDGSVLTYLITVDGDGDMWQQAGSRIRLFIKNSNILREQLECPVCKLYMRAPIFICQIGHIICSLCKKSLKSCPTCRAHFASSRIFALEGIAENSEIPCQYEKDGCTFIGNGKYIEIHEATCVYKE